MQVKDDKLNLSPIRQNRNDYPREYNNCGDDSSRFIPDNGHLCDNIIPDNKYLISSKIPGSRDLVLSFLHICGEKYRIYSIKSENVSNITIIFQILKLLSLMQFCRLLMIN